MNWFKNLFSKRNQEKDASKEKQLLIGSPVVEMNQEEISTVKKLEIIQKYISFVLHKEVLTIYQKFIEIEYPEKESVYTNFEWIDDGFSQFKEYEIKDHLLKEAFVKKEGEIDTLSIERAELVERMFSLRKIKENVLSDIQLEKKKQARMDILALIKEMDIQMIFVLHDIFSLYIEDVRKESEDMLNLLMEDIHSKKEEDMDSKTILEKTIENDLNRILNYESNNPEMENLKERARIQKEMLKTNKKTKNENSVIEDLRITLEVIESSNQKK